MKTRMIRFLAASMVACMMITVLSSCGMARRARVRKIERRLDTLELKVERLEQQQK